jgi:hypothetical protein
VLPLVPPSHWGNGAAAALPRRVQPEARARACRVCRDPLHAEDKQVKSTGSAKASYGQPDNVVTNTLAAWLAGAPVGI